MMKIIVGLGNPEKQQANNRHNAGFMVIDRLAVGLGVAPTDWQTEGKWNAMLVKKDDWLLVKPLTYMNRSGESVRKIFDFYKVGITDLWVAHDDLDIRLGEYKIQVGIGPKIHNGVNSVEMNMSSLDFGRVRIGVDNRLAGQARSAGDAYVLADFSAEERPILEEVLQKVARELREKLK